MKGDKVFLLSQNAGRDDPRGRLILLPDKSRICGYRRKPRCPEPISCRIARVEEGRWVTEWAMAGAVEHLLKKEEFQYLLLC